jgi:hypothetical protein
MIQSGAQLSGRGLMRESSYCEVCFKKKKLGRGKSKLAYFAEDK